MTLRVEALLGSPKAVIEHKAYYRPDIDGLRGVAVGLVMLYHLLPSIFKNGFLGVDIFFVISGFVVTQALERNLSRGHLAGLFNFYSRRIKRILPALYVNLIATIILSSLLIPPSELRSLFKTAASAVVGMSNVALIYARFDYFTPDLALNPFVQTWSLGVEEQFYLLFPALLLLGGSLAGWTSRRFNVSYLLAGLAALSLLYWGYCQTYAPMSVFYNPLARFWELLIGAVLALNWGAVSSFIDVKRGVLLQVFAAVFLLIALAVLPHYDQWNPFANVFVVAGTALAIAIGFRPSRRLSVLLSSDLLVGIGRISYSLYLWHYSIFSLARWNADLTQPTYAVLTLLLTFLISYLSYRFVELPFRYASL
jgi:peptidoglycan/LPS O-acetylase OafA/YrhL